MNQKPNIIYILGDDHRADHLGCAGHPILKTPNLDQLAKDGVRFSHAFCTSPVCTPSRACHYTGLWERTHGVNFNSGSSLSLEHWHESFPMVLKRAGYFLGWVGKDHVPVGDGGGSGQLETDFDYWYGNYGHTGFYPKDLFEDGGLYRSSEKDTQVELFAEAVADFLSPSERFRENAVEPFPVRPPDDPFCLCVTFNLPHVTGIETMQQREDDDDLYKSAYRDKAHLFKPPESFVSYDDSRKNPKLPPDLYSGVYLKCYDFVKDAESLVEQQIRSCQVVEGMDRFVGQLRQQLETLGLADNTIIIFSTDHGLHFGEHGIGGKCFLYEEDIRIPLIIYDPRQDKDKAGQVRDEIIAAPDLASTVLDLCGQDIPSCMQGLSLKPLLDGLSIDWRDELFTEQLMDIQNYPRHESVRTKDMKYIRYFARAEDPEQEGNDFRSTLDNYQDFLHASLNGEEPVYEELFDLKNDPHEMHNLATDPAYAGALNHLRKRLLVLGKEVL
ncbi:MAG: sulfatase-like hydrolase/transferase [Lentisphaeria bacterium]|nr:sulfatase-like hydrolase/transferase [Lentisphaeria bacterium]